MRWMDAILTFPPQLLAVAIMGSLGADVTNVILAEATPSFLGLGWGYNRRRLVGDRT